jgi:uncharacterized protein
VFPTPDLRNHRAVVTGASSGIGAAMARRLAAWGCDLLLTARRAERLEALAEELHGAYGVRAEWIALDLGRPDAAETLWRAAYDGGADVDILINNAGFGAYQYFGATPWQRNAEMLQLNVVALAELTHRFLQVMGRRGRRSYILNSASIVAFIPMPYFANYGATKAYVQVFSESLAAELRGTNVSVTSLCSGGARTEFSQMAGQRLSGMAFSSLMDADRVAAVGLRAMLRRKRHVVPGGMNRLLCLCTRLLPRRTAGAVAVKMIGKPAPQGTARSFD